MSLFLDDGDVKILLGDAREALRELPDGSVHCIATSPPFFGLRDYGTGRWEGGDPDCDHERPSTTMNVGFNWGQGGGEKRQERKSGDQYAGSCPKCGAERIDAQIGLEANPFDWASSIVEVMREARRVLRDDGSLWIECGDSYAGSNRGGVSPQVRETMDERPNVPVGNGGTRPAQAIYKSPVDLPEEMKPTDLVGAPWILAQALRAPYYAGEIRAERDRVWLAATLDAEGSISGHRHERRDDPGRVRTGCHVTITNTSEAMLDEAHRIWPASRIQHERRDTSLGERPCWRWVATNVDRNALLMRELYPYLIAKRTQALLAYNLFELSRISKRIGKTAEGAEARGRREWIVAALSDANHGRPVDLPNWIASPPSVLEKGWYLRGAYVWEKPDAMPESVENRCTTSHSMVFHLTKSSEDAIYWTHRDGRGTRTKPKPDYRWIDRQTGEERTEAQGGREWKRVNLWRGRSYFFDRDAIREPFSDYSTGGDGGSYGSNADAVRTTDSGPRGSTRYLRPRPQGEYVQPTLDGDVPPAEVRGADGRRVLTRTVGARSHENYGEFGHEEGRSRWPSLEGRSPRSVWRITTEASSLGLCRVCRTFWAERAPARHCGEDVVAHFAVWPHELVGKIINAATSEGGCCADCGAPRVRRLERDPKNLDLSRPQARRALELAAQHGLTDAHLDAIRSCGVADAGRNQHTQSGFGRNDVEEQRLADEAKVALGGYLREFLLARPTTAGWQATCACDAATVPCVVLDVFAGSGTTGRQARKMGRHAILVELSPDYAEIAAHRLAQQALALIP